MKNFHSLLLAGHARQDELSMGASTGTFGTAPKWQRAARVALRVVGALMGGYAFSAAAVALTCLALVHLLDLSGSEAVVSASLAGFLLYLLVLLWAFSVRSLWRLWGLLWGGALLGHALLRAISP